MYIAFGQDSRLAPIHTVSRGLACLCRCIVCGEAVIARQGEIREWHYAHVSNREDCLISGETVLHLLVKQCIKDGGGALKVPDRPPGRALPDPFEKSIKDGWIQFDRIDLEVSLEGVRPDLIGYAGDHLVAIEVAYSSFCDLDKAQQLENLNLSTLEIDIRMFDPMNYDEDAVRHAVLAQVEHKRWIYCSESVPSPAAATPPSFSIPFGTTTASTATPPRARPEHLLSVIICERSVSLWRLPWGQLTVKYDYGDEVRHRVREQIAHRFHGRWNGQYRNWTFNACWEEEIRAQMCALAAAVA